MTLAARPWDSSKDLSFVDRTCLAGFPLLVEEILSPAPQIRPTTHKSSPLLLVHAASEYITSPPVSVLSLYEAKLSLCRHLFLQSCPYVGKYSWRTGNAELACRLSGSIAGFNTSRTGFPLYQSMHVFELKPEPYMSQFWFDIPVYRLIFLPHAKMIVK